MQKNDPLAIIKLIVLLMFFSGCSSSDSKEKELVDASHQLERDLEMYEYVWTNYVNGDTTVMSEKYFTKDVVVVTADGDLVGLEACREYYGNYLTGFSEVEWNIVDAFGQGDKLMKHWHFKGKHTGMFFDLEPTGNYLDMSGTTIVTLRDGRIAKEHDFFDMKTMIDQLSKSEGDLVIDEYKPVN